MEFIKSIKKRYGVDVGYHQSNLHPEDGEGRVGKSGIDKNYTLGQILGLAYSMRERPNIIIKGGKNAKWYLKKFPLNELENEIEKQSWRDNSNRIMWVIEWDE